MSNNREFSQLASYVEVSEGNNSIGIATGGTQSIGIATASITFEGTTGYINAKGFYKDGVEVAPTVSGISGVWLTTSAGIHTTKNVGIGTTNPSANLDVVGYTELDDINVSGVSTFTGAIDANGNLDVDGHTELDDINVSGIATLGTVQISSGIVTAASGIVTYYGDGSNLTDILTSIIDDTSPQLGGNLDANSKDISGVNNLNVTGIATFQDKVGIGTTQALVALDVAGAIRQELHTPVMPVGLNNDIGEKFVKIEMEDGTNFIETFYAVVYCGGGIVIAGGGVDEGDGDIYRSTDYGRTWIRIDTTDLGNPVLIRSGVYCGNGIILLGSGHSTFSNPEVLRSTDYGLTWSRVTISSTTSNITSDLVYCGISTVVVSTIPSSTSLQISSDNGATWSSLTAFGNNGGSQDSVEYLGNDILLAGVRNTFDNKSDIHRSTDFGSTWDIIDMGIDIEYIYSIKYLENGIVLVGSGSDAGDGDIHRSTDYGQTWDKIEMGPDLECIFSIKYIGNGIVLAGGGSGSGDGDVYKSSDYGLTWTKVFNTNLKTVVDIENCGNGIILFGSGTDSGTGDIYRSDVGFSQASTIQGIYHQHLTGNIGIGSTQPTATLDVGGTLSVSGVSSFQSDVNIGVGLSIATSENATDSRTFISLTSLTQDKVSLGFNTTTNYTQAAGGKLAELQFDPVRSFLDSLQAPNIGVIDPYDTDNYFYEFYSRVDAADTNNRYVKNKITKGSYVVVLDDDYEFVVSGTGSVNGTVSGTNDYAFKVVSDAQTELYYNQTKKLETTDNGVVVTGVLTATTFSGSGSGLTDLPSLWSSNSDGIYSLNNVGIGTTANTDGAKLLIDVGTATTAFDVVGSQGHLFGVTNNLSSGSIFAVNDISGLASIDVDANGTIQLAPYNPLEKVGIGITNPSYKVDVNGDIRAGQTSSEGLILTSPNGTKYRLSVDNSGNLSTSAV